MAIQRLADELVGNSYGRAPLLQGLYQGHIGAICDALIAAGIDPAVWTATQVKNALNEDMKARRSFWPDRIERPAAFLASRLRRLPAQPPHSPAARAATSSGDRKPSAGQQPDAATTPSAAHVQTQRWYSEVTGATTVQQRQTLLRAHSVKFENSRPATDPFAALASAGRRAARRFPDVALVDAMMRWAREVLGEECETTAPEQVSGPTSLADDLLLGFAIGGCGCAMCGSPRGIERPELPLKAMSVVCDKCWPAIAAELTQASDPGQEG